MKIQIYLTDDLTDEEVVSTKVELTHCFGVSNVLLESNQKLHECVIKVLENRWQGFGVTPDGRHIGHLTVFWEDLVALAEEAKRI